jgi:NitT/TauT family transport system substrate-binding protein
MTIEIRSRLAAILAATLVTTSLALPARADDKLHAAVGQKGFWDTMVTVLASDKGFFKKEGLDVDITWTSGGGETLQAVLSGGADVAVAIGMSSCIGAYAKGAPVRVIASQMTGANDLFWYVPATSAIKTKKDMDGHTIGFTRPGSSTDLAARLFAKEAGITLKFVSTGEAAPTLTQVMSGQLDIGWSVPPFALDKVKAGEIRIMGSGNDVPDLVHQSTRAVLASVDLLTKRRDVARRYMKVYAETVEWMYANLDDSVAYFAKFNNIPVDIAKQGASFYSHEALQIVPVQNLSAAIQQAVDFKMIDKAIPEAEAQKMIDFVYDPRVK